MKSYKVVGNGYYRITEERKVVRADGRPLDLPETEKTVSISIYGMFREVEKEWLFWLSFFKLELPMLYRINVFDYEFKEHSALKHMKVDPMIVKFKSPVYLTNNRDFRLIARFPNYAIDFMGNIINMTTRIAAYIKKPLNKNYLKSNIVDQAELYKSATFATHRLVALTWVDIDDYVKHPIVDHKDGDKTNCHYTNLEWVSYSGNNKAAVNTGLRKDNKITLSRNIDTGEVKEHASLTDASKYIGRSTIDSARGNLRPNRVWTGTSGRYELKLKSDKRDWYFLGGEVLPKINKKVLITITDENDSKWCYDDSSEFRDKELGIKGIMSMDVAIERFKAKYPKRTIEVERLDDRFNGGVEARHLSSMKVHHGRTIEELSRIINIPKSTLTKYISLSDGYKIGDYQVRVRDDRDWETKPKDVNYMHKARPLQVIDIVTGEIKKFPSYRKVAEQLKIDKKTVKKILKEQILLRSRFKIIMP